MPESGKGKPTVLILDSRPASYPCDTHRLRAFVYLLIASRRTLFAARRSLTQPPRFGSLAECVKQSRTTIPRESVGGCCAASNAEPWPPACAARPTHHSS